MGKTDCECEGPRPGDKTFFCERHQLTKNKVLFQLCRTRPDYFQEWEEGRGPMREPEAYADPTQPQPSRLGKDLVEALATVEVTKNFVVDCLTMGTSCEERSKKLVELQTWVTLFHQGEFLDDQTAVEELLEILL